MHATVSRFATFAIAVGLLVGLVMNAPSARITPYHALTAGTSVSRVAIVGDSYTNGTAIGGQGANAWPDARLEVTRAPGRASGGRRGG